MADQSDVAARISKAEEKMEAARLAMGGEQWKAAESLLVQSWLVISMTRYDCGGDAELQARVEIGRKEVLSRLAMVEVTIGAGQRQQGNRLDAAKYALRAGKRFRQAGQFRNRALALENAANAYVEMKRPDRAEPLYRTCLGYFETSNDDEKIMEVNGMLQQLNAQPLCILLENYRRRNALCVTIEGMLGSGNTQDALSLCETALAKVPDFAGAWDMKGRCLCALRRPEEALKCHQRSVECDPADPVAFRALAHQLDAMGQYMKAFECQCPATDLAPEDGELWYGYALYLLKCYEADLIPSERMYLLLALTSLDEAIEFGPYWTASYRRKAELLHLLGYVRAAQEAVDEGRAAGMDDSEFGAIISEIREASREQQ